MRYTHLLRQLSILPVVFLAGCGGSGGGSSSAVTVDTGNLKLSVTDAALDSAVAVLVQFTGVSIKPKDGEALDIALEGDSQTCLDLFNDNPPAPTPAGESTVRCIDLLTLQGRQSITLLDNVELDAGEYNWLRLHVRAERNIEDSIIVLDDGSRESLFIPGGDESGLKLNSSFTILPGDNHDFVIDFDLRKSVNNPQGFADYRLKPSLRLVDNGTSGHIRGTVPAHHLTTDNCTENAYAVYVFAGGAGTTIGDEGSDNSPMTSAKVQFDDGEWRYEVGFLPPGDYTVVFTCEAGNDDPEIDEFIEFEESPHAPPTVTVVSGQDTIVDF